MIKKVTGIDLLKKNFESVESKHLEFFKKENRAGQWKNVIF